MQNYEDVCEYSIEQFQDPGCVQRYQSYKSKNDSRFSNQISDADWIAACDHGVKTNATIPCLCEKFGGCPEFITDLINYKNSDEISPEDLEIVNSAIKEWGWACREGNSMAIARYEDNTH